MIKKKNLTCGIYYGNNQFYGVYLYIKTRQTGKACLFYNDQNKKNIFIYLCISKKPKKKKNTIVIDSIDIYGVVCLVSFDYNIAYFLYIFLIIVDNNSVVDSRGGDCQ